MRSLILGSSALVLLAAASASAAQPVTTGDTELPDFSVVIVSPEDGAVFEGSPDAVVPVTIEFEFFGHAEVELLIDNAASAGTCPEEPPCTIEVTLPPGVHELWAIGDNVGLQDSHKITVEVKDTGADTESPTSSASDTDTGSEPDTDTGSEPAPTDTDTTDSASDGADGDGGEKGCVCSAGSGAPDLLGLALFALVAPWRRRRHA